MNGISGTTSPLHLILSIVILVSTKKSIKSMVWHRSSIFVESRSGRVNSHLKIFDGIKAAFGESDTNNICEKNVLIIFALHAPERICVTILKAILINIQHYSFVSCSVRWSLLYFRAHHESFALWLLSLQNCSTTWFASLWVAAFTVWMFTLWWLPDRACSIE